MKSYSLILSVLLMAGAVAAQVSIEEVAYPEPGDTVTRYVDLSPVGVEITEPGPDQLWQWDLSMELPQVSYFDTNDRADIFPFASIRLVNTALDDYYNIVEGGWLLMGSEGADPIGAGFNVETFYSPVFREEYAPIAYQDSMQQIFDVYSGIPLAALPDTLLEMLPILPDSMRARVAMNVTDKVDAWGSLEINGTSVDVLRQYREMQLAVAIEAKISILPWQDVTDLILSFIPELPFGIQLKDTLTSYRFLAPFYGQPVAEVFLEADTADRVEFQLEILSGLGQPLPQLADFNVYPNPASDQLTLDLRDFELDVNRVIIYDMTGRPVMQSAVQIGDLKRVSLDDFADGLYVATLWSGKGQLTGMTKFTVLAE